MVSVVMANSKCNNKQIQNITRNNVVDKVKFSDVYTEGVSDIGMAVCISVITETNLFCRCFTTLRATLN